ncbi:hypothetical protein GCM10010293_49690 [Streptomyces griseoflavus]|nr:hypothetical protein GCM10010293_49690 [Streptomyces griseoflavus]
MRCVACRDEEVLDRATLSITWGTTDVVGMTTPMRCAIAQVTWCMEGIQVNPGLPIDPWTPGLHARQGEACGL